MSQFIQKCVLTCVEPCKTYEIHRNREEKLLQLRLRLRKCKFLYHYWIDPQFGFMSARIQTWFPFSIQVCMNGREWLARRMDEAGMDYQRYDNSFPWVGDFPKAQKLMDRMQAIRWPKVLDGVAKRLNPAYGSMFRGLDMAYYWSAYQTEWATDLAFASKGALAAIYPPLVRGAIATFASRDVMRFLGKRPDRRYSGEVVSDYGDRPEGVRVKHLAFGNSLKVYDKGGSILRVETTINQPGALAVVPSQPARTGREKVLATDAQGGCRLAPPGGSLSAVQRPLLRCPGFPGHDDDARHAGGRGVPSGHQGRQALPRSASLVRRGSEAPRSLERRSVCGSGILQS